MFVEKMYVEIDTTSSKEKQELGLLFPSFTHRLFIEVLVFTQQWTPNAEGRNASCGRHSNQIPGR